jgi:hypothetical protein
MLLSNYKFSFMGNIQLQVVKENPESPMPVGEEVVYGVPDQIVQIKIRLLCLSNFIV